MARAGASEATQILRRRDVRLFRTAFQPADDAPADELVKAGRGDKDAAARLARNYGRDGNALRHQPLRRLAAVRRRAWATASPATSWRCTTGVSAQPLLAAQYESRARELGYTPPPSLDNTRK